jgi:hypothetical protein
MCVIRVAQGCVNFSKNSDYQEKSLELEWEALKLAGNVPEQGGAFSTTSGPRGNRSGSTETEYGNNEGRLRGIKIYSEGNSWGMSRYDCHSARQFSRSCYS